MGDRPNRCLQNVGLLQNVPNFPQRLDWYGLTQAGAIANAPRPKAPQPALPRWSPAPAAPQVVPCMTASGPANQRDFSQRSSTLNLQIFNQQAHFILDLAAIQPKTPWLRPPDPLPPPIHPVWKLQNAQITTQEMLLATQPPLEPIVQLD